jgi:hypothetical protein
VWWLFSGYAVAGRNNSRLVGALEHFLFFHIIIGKFIIPTDEVHHFSEG